jgi:hypothetical protein
MEVFCNTLLLTACSMRPRAGRLCPRGGLFKVSLPPRVYAMKRQPKIPKPINPLSQAEASVANFPIRTLPPPHITMQISHWTTDRMGASLIRYLKASEQEGEIDLTQSRRSALGKYLQQGSKPNDMRSTEVAYFLFMSMCSV